MAAAKRRTRPRTPKNDWYSAFLGALADGASITRAAETAGIGRRTAFDHRQRDEDFALAWHEAAEAGADRLEDEARRRAAEGTLKPIYQGGKLVGEVREYSDTLLIFLLKGKRPEVFRENVKVEHSGSVDQNIDLVGIHDPDARQEALRILHDSGAI